MSQNDTTGASEAPISLTERVAALEELVQELGTGFAREVDDVKDAILELTGQPPTTGANGTDGDAETPLPWAPRATAQDWTDLAQWVDWLAATYDLQPSKAVLPCWPAHGGAVHELAVLRTAWLSASAIDASDNPGDAMALWHERSLRTCLLRLREDYQLRSCADKHTAPRPARPTSPELLAAVQVHASSAESYNVDNVTGELR